MHFLVGAAPVFKTALRDNLLVRRRNPLKLCSGTQEKPSIWASTNLLTSPKTATKKPYRPTSNTLSPRVPRSTFLNTKNGQNFCPSKKGGWVGGLMHFLVGAAAVFKTALRDNLLVRREKPSKTLLRDTRKSRYLGKHKLACQPENGG